MDLDLYFSEHFGVDPAILDEYGAFDISMVSDLPLFIDPFLLFNSDNPVYQQLHEEILRYLRFLRDQAMPDLDKGLINAWYRFKEVKQNWLGYTLFGNDGAGLGEKFAFDLHGALGDILANFGEETVTRGSHLEKLCLIRPGVGKDNISDFTTNLIKAYLCEYTQTFAREHMRDEDCQTFAVTRAWFNYETRTWVTERYYLPRLRQDFVLLTPVDVLTRDDTWINYGDMIAKFSQLPDAVANAEQRASINQYFKRALGSDPDAKQRRKATADTIRRFPELIDLYIRLQEDDGDRAHSVSASKVQDTYRALVAQIRHALADIAGRTEFYDKPWRSYDECLQRARYFKSYIEDNDGYLLFNRAGKPFSNEKELQLAFGLVWCGTDFDINREVNNGRGPVDFKASFGAGDKSLIEFKLASNTALKRNLEKQVEIYEAANKTRTSVKVIVIYTAAQAAKVERILRDLKLVGEESIVLIDARDDNKPSASKA
ncbi:hypothetical protein [Actinomadura sp. DC4]|uniref:hypothetical protein n=1 Tax=Actinomadura sp. DC4 TaxID=3055069 RepID=UPI0025B14249|nr:hypothetical protein [Actinomadura sp. DC4]MDN3360152.1 hypothetical protein [Actinomadura sp. DC4]